MVALYWPVNLLEWYRFIKDVFPTPESPSIITFNNTFCLRPLMMFECYENGQISSKDRCVFFYVTTSQERQNILFFFLSVNQSGEKYYFPKCSLMLGYNNCFRQ
mmetsp:Transcript_18858/g.28135  ORF Transcript_18858/g.28135 Transcript_18858/m.28135 type:complete len:104 (-) Transcript_18858:110-421(-)